jgi:hypothetical protein
VKPQRCIASADCYRACVATICERPAHEVPDFGALAKDDIDEMYRAAREWLHSQGFGLFSTYCSAGWPLEKVLSVFSADNPGVPMIIAGVAGSNPAETHAVIALNGAIAHDPSGARVVGPWKCDCKPDCERGWWWIDVITAFPQSMEVSQCKAA